MKRIQLAALAGVLSMATFTPAAFAATNTSSNVVETMHGWVSYHTEPKLSSPVTGRLQLGDAAPLVKKANNYWYEIRWNGKDVYITTNSKFTKVVATSATASSSGSSSSSSGQAQTQSGQAATTSPSKNGDSAASSVIETVQGWVGYHTQPNLNSPVVGRLQLGDAAPLVEKANNYWYEIRWNNQDVYITTNSTFTKVVTQSGATLGGQSSGTGTGTAPSAGETGGASSGSTPSSTSTPSWQAEADKVIATAKTQLDVPYLWGHQEPGVGFDCSNFTAWSYRTALGISFSGSSKTQRDSVGTPVALSDIREGDLLFFATSGNSTGSGHVGIYMGNGQVIQEGGGWGKVTIEPLSGTWLGRNLVFARRVIGN